MAKVIDDAPKEFGAQSFLFEIEKLREKDSIDYMDAILHYCERNEIEIESVAQYIRKNLVLKAKIQEEAEELNFLQKTARLPI